MQNNVITAWANDEEYMFLEKGNIVFRRDARSGNKRLLVASASDKPLEKVDFAEIYWQHGAPTADAPGSYAYMILPGKRRYTSPEGATFTDRSPESATVTVLEHTDQIHAAQNMRDGSGAAVFWKAGRVCDLSVDAPCIVLWRRGSEKDRWVVSVTDPTHATRKIKVNWEERGWQTVEVRDGRPSEITF